MPKTAYRNGRHKYIAADGVIQAWVFIRPRQVPPLGHFDLHRQTGVSDLPKVAAQ